RRWCVGCTAVGSSPTRRSSDLAAVLLLVVGTVWGLAFAPRDYQQGNSFRIIYIHVPAAILAQSIYLMLAVAGVVGLVWKMKLAEDRTSTRRNSSHVKISYAVFC